MRVSAVLFGLMGFSVGMLSDSYITALGGTMLLCNAISILWITAAIHAERSKQRIHEQYQQEIKKLRQEFWALYFSDREAGKKVHTQVTKKHAQILYAMTLFMSR